MNEEYLDDLEIAYPKLVKIAKGKSWFSSVEMVEEAENILYELSTLEAQVKMYKEENAKLKNTDVQVVTDQNCCLWQLLNKIEQEVNKAMKRVKEKYGK